MSTDQFSFPGGNAIGVPIVTDQTRGPNFGLFDVSDWPSLLMGIQTDGSLAGARLKAQYQVCGGAFVGGGIVERSVQVRGGLGGLAANGLVVVQNLSRFVTVSLDITGGFGHAPSAFVAPCGYSQQQLWNIPGSPPGTLLHVPGGPIGAGATLAWLMPPYKGIAQVVFQTFGGGPYTLQIDAFDYTGVLQSRLLGQPGLNGNSIGAGYFEFPTVPSPMQVSVVNAGAAGIVAVDVTIKERG